MHKIDYILVRRKWQNSVKYIEAYNTFSNIGSDHRVVTVRFRVSLRSNRVHKPREIRHDWKAFRADTDMQTQYAVQVKNRYATLQQSEAEL